jgi:serine/threonine protein kinase
VDSTAFPEQKITTNNEDNSMVGTVLNGHLKILNCLGAGGMSVVYKAEDVLLNRVVAVKVLHSHSALNPQNVLRFRQEAMAASKIDHPNVIRIYEFNIPENGQPYLVMDYIQGQSLAEFIKENGPIELRRAVSILGTICDGLQCAHDAGVVHRDLKPGNIMLLKDATGKQTLKIVDFGIAKLLTEDAQGHALTQTGEVFGSPLYMSPEQCYGRPLDRRSDLYALGCVMYEICTGQPPIKGKSMLETIQMHTTAFPPPAATVNPGIKCGDKFDAIIFKALAKDPDDRYQTTAEFKTALEKLFDNQAPDRSEPKTFLQKYQLPVGLCAAILVASLGYALIQKLPVASPKADRSGKNVATIDKTDPSSIKNPQSSTNGTNQLQPVATATQNANAKADAGANPDAYTDISCYDDNDLKSKLQERDPHTVTRLSAANSKLTDAGLKLIDNKLNLNYLNLQQCKSITDKSGPTVARQTNLQRLNASKTAIGDSFLKDISALKHLNYAWIHATNITGDGMQYVAKLPELTELAISGTPIKNTGFKKLSDLKLNILRARRTLITGEALKNLEAMQSLTLLTVGNNKIGDAGVISIAKLQNLAELDLDNADISDHGIEQLLALQNLQTLSLTGNHLSDKSIDVLLKLPRLKSLSIVRCNISPSALKRFAQARPNCFLNQ